jgi:hypothetical protein
MLDNIEVYNAIKAGYTRDELMDKIGRELDSVFSSRDEEIADTRADLVNTFLDYFGALGLLDLKNTEKVDLMGDELEKNIIELYEG